MSRQNYRSKLKIILEVLDTISLHVEISISRIALNCRVSPICLKPYLNKLIEKGILLEQVNTRKKHKFYSRTFRFTHKGKLAHQQLKHCISLLQEMGIEE